MGTAAASQRWELSEGDRPRTGCRFRDRCPVYHAKGEPAVCRWSRRRSPSSWRSLPAISCPATSPTSA